MVMVVTIFGIVAILWLLWLWYDKIFTWLSCFLGPAADLKKFQSSTGKSWAVITGASDGVGKQFAYYLAKRGFNLILISRTLEKLQTVAWDVEKRWKVETETISVDFSAPPDVVGEKVLGHEIFSRVQPTVLINNVGIVTDVPDCFHKVSHVNGNDVIRVNIEISMFMIRLLLPAMVENHRGLVVNLGSSLGTFLSPYSAVYSASKAFLAALTNCLREEYRGSGVMFQCLTPWWISTAMTLNPRESFLIVSPRKFVNSAAKFIGKSKAPTIVTPCLSHKLIDLACALLPGRAMGQLHMRYYRAKRARMLSKMQRKGLVRPSDAAVVEREGGCDRTRFVVLGPGLRDKQERAVE